MPIVHGGTRLKRLNIHLTDSQLTKLEELATKLGLDRSKVIRKAINEYYELEINSVNRAKEVQLLAHALSTVMHDMRSMRNAVVHNMPELGRQDLMSDEAFMVLWKRILVLAGELDGKEEGDDEKK